MPVFPTSESEINALAQQMLGGYSLHAGDFPHVRRNTLLNRHRSYQLAARLLEQRLALWRSARAARKDSFAELKRVMKECLKLSQVDTTAAPEKLSLIGWGPRRGDTALTAPTAPRNLRIQVTAADSVRLTWQAPAAASHAGPVYNYLIERRELLPQQTPGPWQLITTTYQTTITLPGQPRGAELQYRVKAANPAGVSRPGNSTTILL